MVKDAIGWTVIRPTARGRSSCDHMNTVESFFSKCQSKNEYKCDFEKNVKGLFRLNMLPGFGFRKSSATHTQHWANN